MRRVSRQEVQRYTSKYLKEIPLIITNRSEDELIVENISNRGKVATVIEKKLQKPNRDPLKYGCGCLKVPGKFLCEKHGRV